MTELDRIDRRYLPAAERERKRANVLDAAMQEARRVGCPNVQRERIARIAKVSTGTVSIYFGNMAAVRRLIMRTAIERGDLDIIASGLAARDPAALAAPAELRRQALEHITREE